VYLKLKCCFTSGHFMCPAGLDITRQSIDSMKYAGKAGSAACGRPPFQTFSHATNFPIQESAKSLNSLLTKFGTMNETLDEENLLATLGTRLWCTQRPFSKTVEHAIGSNYVGNFLMMRMNENSFLVWLAVPQWTGSVPIVLGHLFFGITTMLPWMSHRMEKI